MNSNAKVHVLDEAIQSIALAVDAYAMAIDSGISRANFARTCKRMVGATPKTMIKHARIRQSMKLLRNETMPPLADIAFSCGYCSQSHFCTAFKLATGLTPLGYRAGMEPIKFIGFR